MHQQNQRLRLLACLIFLVFGVLLLAHPVHARNTPVGDMGFWKSYFDLRIGSDLVYSNDFEYQVREVSLESDPGIIKRKHILVANDRRKYEKWSLELGVNSYPVGGGTVTNYGKFCADLYFQANLPIVALCKFPYNEDISNKNENIKLINAETGAIEKDIDLPLGTRYTASYYSGSFPKFVDNLLLLSESDTQTSSPKTSGVDLQAGAVRWTTHLRQNGEATVVDQDLIYRRTEPHPTLPPSWEFRAERIVRFDIATGTWLWTSEPFEDVRGMMFKSGEDLFYAVATALDNQSSFILAMQPSNGAELFRIESDIRLTLPTEFDGDLLYGGNLILTGHDFDDRGYKRGPHKIFRYDLETKKLLWTKTMSVNEVPLYYNGGSIVVKEGIGVANYYESEMDCDKEVRFDLNSGNIISTNTECDSDD